RSGWDWQSSLLEVASPEARVRDLPIHLGDVMLMRSLHWLSHCLLLGSVSTVAPAAWPAEQGRAAGLASPAGGRGVRVDIKIESREEGRVVLGKSVTLTGRASSTGPAGATRVALVIDVSGSTTESSSSDLDGDGKEESILQAELAAGRLLVDELEKVEAKG